MRGREYQRSRRGVRTSVGPPCSPGFSVDLSFERLETLYDRLPFLAGERPVVLGWRVEPEPELCGKWASLQPEPKERRHDEEFGVQGLDAGDPHARAREASQGFQEGFGGYGNGIVRGQLDEDAVGHGRMPARRRNRRRALRRKGSSSRLVVSNVSPAFRQRRARF